MCDDPILTSVGLPREKVTETLTLHAGAVLRMLAPDDPVLLVRGKGTALWSVKRDTKVRVLLSSCAFAAVRPCLWLRVDQLLTGSGVH